MANTYRSLGLRDPRRYHVMKPHTMDVHNNQGYRSKHCVLNAAGFDLPLKFILR